MREILEAGWCRPARRSPPSARPKSIRGTCSSCRAGSGCRRAGREAGTGSWLRGWRVRTSRTPQPEGRPPGSPSARVRSPRTLRPSRPRRSGRSPDRSGADGLDDPAVPGRSRASYATRSAYDRGKSPAWSAGWSAPRPSPCRHSRRIRRRAGRRASARHSSRTQSHRPCSAAKLVGDIHGRLLTQHDLAQTAHRSPAARRAPIVDDLRTPRVFVFMFHAMLPRCRDGNVTGSRWMRHIRRFPRYRSRENKEATR